ncbi:embryonic polarity protein dorsal [Culex quinquefasciatus]|uniref:embryonic polarity protein dorsal n=1 Tax=Culex quinquefasciatus TaxID=7176 RepID=UPI0018E35037|nr:embryonic polarity protein dorsal [Culex quinquefasciatus]
MAQDDGGLRFRYQCENRGSTAGSILGVGSTAQRRIYPTVEIRNHQGPAKIVITCVTSDDPPRLHPHRLVGHKDCSEGICEMLVEPALTPVMAHSIKNLGVQCIRRKDVDAELRRKEMRYANPFNVPTGNLSTINLNEIRLCFQLHIESYSGQFIPVSHPVLSTIIYDKKSNPDLIICSMSDCTGPASGGKQIILLTEKVNKDDIQVRFFKEFGPDLKPWIAYGAFNPTQDVHKQVAVVFRTPAYYDRLITSPVKVQIQLQRKRSNELSDPLEFEMLPDDAAILPRFDDIFSGTPQNNNYSDPGFYGYQ